MIKDKYMANCTTAVEGVISAVMRYKTEDARRVSFPDTPEVRKKAFSYAMQEFNERLNTTPFHIGHCDICEAVRERLIKEGYLK